MNKIHRFETEVLAIEDLTPTVRHITFSTCEGFVHNAGQFFTLFFEVGEEKFRRPYSIASNDREGSIDLCVKIVEGGKASAIFKEMKVGDRFNCMGPLGRFTFKETEKDVVFICTGTGIAPFRAMVPELLDVDSNRKVTLLCGFRFAEEVIYSEEFLEMERKFPNFKYEVTVSRPYYEHTGHKGRIQGLVDQFVSGGESVYLCGLWDMIQDVSELLKSKGIERADIHFERYD